MADFQKLRLRLHEWLADHVKWVQYPRQQYIPARQQPAFIKRPKLGFIEALAIFQLGLAGILASLVLLAFGLAFAWLLVQAILAT